MRPLQNRKSFKKLNQQAGADIQTEKLPSGLCEKSLKSVRNSCAFPPCRSKIFPVNLRTSPVGTASQNSIFYLARVSQKLSPAGQPLAGPGGARRLPVPSKTPEAPLFLLWRKRGAHFFLRKRVLGAARQALKALGSAYRAIMLRAWIPEALLGIISSSCCRACPPAAGCTAAFRHTGSRLRQWRARWG